MQKLLASLALASSLTFGVVGVLQADAWTNATDRYMSGQLESRLQELGTNKQTGVFTPQWRLTIEEGVKRHCRFTLAARGTVDPSGKCK